ncbi:MAG: hypothetical protein C0517_02330 [Erythrobacter sp.]|nr:hypothetical protein [Erythrobacter sp.]
MIGQFTRLGERAGNNRSVDFRASRTPYPSASSPANPCDAQADCQHFNAALPMAIKPPTGQSNPPSRPQDAQALPRYSAFNQGTPISTGEVNALEPAQAYVDVECPDALGDGSSIKVQAGRFLLNIGSCRLVAADDYRNTTSGYTGLRADARIIREPSSGSLDFEVETIVQRGTVSTSTAENAPTQTSMGSPQGMIALCCLRVPGAAARPLAGTRGMYEIGNFRSCSWPVSHYAVDSSSADNHYPRGAPD